ncbi:uncharacterized protein [Panulirus ornatus]|uniref:uncharacterized protein n=1 Tax=Panulirus ornatus TaxID=150431 RepID=UPI003A8B4E38
MFKCSQLGAVIWILIIGLVLLPCTVVMVAIIIVGKSGMYVLAVALVVYCSAILVWIILKYCQRQSGEEQVVGLASDQDLPAVTIQKTPSCSLTLPTLAPVYPTEHLPPPLYALVQALSRVPDGELASPWTCRQVFGETCSGNCAMCGPQATSHLDDSDLPTYSELVESGVIQSFTGDSVST